MALTPIGQLALPCQSYGIVMAVAKVMARSWDCHSMVVLYGKSFEARKEIGVGSYLFGCTCCGHTHVAQYSFGGKSLTYHLHMAASS